MAEQVITFREAGPEEDAVTLTFEPKVPLPAFIELEDGDGTVHRYVPAKVELQWGMLLEGAREALEAARSHLHMERETIPIEEAALIYEVGKALREAIAACEAPHP